jgi:hypothetical protein
LNRKYLKKKNVLCVWECTWDAGASWGRNVMGSLEGSEIMVFKLSKEIADTKADI